MGNLNGFLLYADEPCPRPEPEDVVNRELIAFIESRRRELGLSLSDLAKRYNPRKPHKMRRALDSFLKTAKMHPAYLAFLAGELDFSLEEVAELERCHDRRIHRQRNLFIEHFDLIEAHADRILASPGFRSISFHGMGIYSCYVGVHRPLTIGDLLRLYRQGLWISDTDCCDRVHILFGVGSPLTGINSFRGFCRGCGRLVVGELGSFSRLFFPARNVMEEQPYEPGPETVESLVIDLNRGRGN